MTSSVQRRRDEQRPTSTGSNTSVGAGCSRPGSAGDVGYSRRECCVTTYTVSIVTLNVRIRSDGDRCLYLDRNSGSSPLPRRCSYGMRSLNLWICHDAEAQRRNGTMVCRAKESRVKGVSPKVDDRQQFLASLPALRQSVVVGKALLVKHPRCTC